MALFTLISGIQYFISGKDLFRQDIIKQSAHK
jgi:hypothetical protein